MLVLVDRDLGGQNRPPRHKFSVTSVGVVFNRLNPPNPPDKSNAAVEMSALTEKFACR